MCVCVLCASVYMQWPHANQSSRATTRGVVCGTYYRNVGAGYSCLEGWTQLAVSPPEWQLAGTAAGRWEYGQTGTLTEEKTCWNSQMSLPVTIHAEGIPPEKQVASPTELCLSHAYDKLQEELSRTVRSARQCFLFALWLIPTWSRSQSVW